VAEPEKGGNRWQDPAMEASGQVARTDDAHAWVEFGPWANAGLAQKNSKLFDFFRTISNGIGLIRSKDVLPEFENFQIKYRFIEN
jgi:hypothetical protein